MTTRHGNDNSNTMTTTTTYIHVHVEDYKDVCPLDNTDKLDGHLRQRKLHVTVHTVAINVSMVGRYIFYGYL